VSDDAMTNPCTRRDLTEALADQPTKQDLQTALANHPTKQDLQRYATKLDLETWGGALMARMDARFERGFAEMRQILDERLDRRFAEMRQILDERLDRRFAEMRQILAESQRTMIAELARHSVANAEDLRTRVRAVDDQYRDLPPRVTKL